jgi:tetratricopeptide (TPR) repeat protein
LLEAEPNIATANEYGTNGQSQYGVDVLGYHMDGISVTALQAKCYREVKEKDIRSAAAEFLKHWETHWKSKNVKEFVVAFAGELTRTEVQNAIVAERQKFQQTGISFSSWGQENLGRKLVPQPELVTKYIDRGKYTSWVERICGTTYVPEAETAPANPSAQIAAPRELGDSIALLTDDMVSHADAMQDSLRQGDLQEVERWLENVKADSTRWALLGPQAKGSVYRTEARVLLNKGDTEGLRKALEEAERLHPSGNDAVLLALAAFHEDKTSEAQELLHRAPVSPEVINLHAYLLLHDGKVEACRQLLEQHAGILKDDAEAMRIESLLLRMEGLPSKARALLERAYVLKPGWLVMRFTKAIFDFESALVPGTLSPAVFPEVRIIDWPFVLKNADALACLRSAYETFEALLQKNTGNPREATLLQGWCLSCLACDHQRQETANEYCASLLQADPVHPYAIMWTLGRGYCTAELGASIDNLEDLRKSRQATTDDIVKLLTCYAAQGRAKDALGVLKKAKGLFVTHGESERWLFWKVQCLAASGQERDALVLLRNLPVEQQPRIRGAISSLGTTTPEAVDAAIDALVREYDRHGDAESLFRACTIMAKHNKWEALSARAADLLSAVPTSEALYLGGFGLFKTGQYAEALKQIDAFTETNPDTKLPKSLAMLEVECKRELGLLKEAGITAQQLHAQYPTDIHVLRMYTDTLQLTGDAPTLQSVVRKAFGDGTIDADASPYFIEQVRGVDTELAAQMLKKMLKEELSDEASVAVIQQAFGLGVEDEASGLLARIETMSKRPGSPVKGVALQELEEMILEERTAIAEAEARYNKAELPLHVLLDRFNGSMSRTFHASLLENRRNSLKPVSILLARHGGMPPADFGEQKPSWQLSADLTSLLLGHHLGVLDAVVQAFGPLRLSPRTLFVLDRMIVRLNASQPSRVAAQREVIRCLDKGLISTIDSSSFELTEKDDLLLQGYPEHWVRAVREVQTRGGTVVDFLPPVRKASSDPHMEVPQGLRHILASRHSLLHSLYVCGPISLVEYEEALQRLGDSSEKEARAYSPRENDVLHLMPGIAEDLARVEVLDITSKRFNATISAREAHQIRESLQHQAENREIAKWLESLRQYLNDGIQSERIGFTPKAPRSVIDPDDISAGACLLDVAAELGATAEVQHFNALWCDDRAVQRNTIRRQFFAVGTYEILKAMVSCKAISEKIYYSLLLQLREENVFFIPLSVEELLYHLRSARVENGQVIETRALACIRRYLARSVRLKWAIVPAADKVQNAADRGEMDVVLACTRLAFETLTALWNSEQYIPETIQAQATWIIRSVRVSYMGSLIVSGTVKHFHNPVNLALLELESSLIHGLSIEQRPAKRRVPRTEFISFIWSAILHPAFRALPTLADALVDRLLGLSSSPHPLLGPDLMSVEEMNDASAEEVSSVQAQMQQRLFADFPDDLKGLFRHQSRHLRRLGVSTQFNFGPYAYNVEDFLKAASDAIDGRDSTCVEQRSQELHRITSEGKDGEQAPLHLISEAGAHIVNDELFWILHNSVSVRRALLERHREWFGCDDKEFARIVDDIVSISQPEARFEAVEEWREDSADVFYDRLLEEVTKSRSVNLARLFPHRIERLYSSFRFNRVGDQSLAEAAGESTVERSIQHLRHEFCFQSCLPRGLSDELVVQVSSLPIELLNDLVSSLQQDVQTVLDRLALVGLLLRTRRPEFEEWVKREIEYALSAEGEKSVKAFNGLVEWVLENSYTRLQEWDTADKLAFAWIHGSHLFRILSYAEAPMEWIEETFRANRSILPILEKDGIAFDICFPTGAAPEVLILTALEWAISGHPDLTDAQKERVVAMAFTPVGPPVGVFWSLHMLRDPRAYSDHLHSFLRIDREELIRRLIDEPYDAQSSLSEGLRKNAVHAVVSLESNPYSYGSWLQLVTGLGDCPPYEEIRSRLELIVNSISVRDVLQLPPPDRKITMAGISLVALHATNHEILLALRKKIMDSAPRIEEVELEVRKDDKLSEQDVSILDQVTGILLSTALYGEDVESRAALFADALEELQRRAPGLAEDIYTFAVHLTDALPPNISSFFWGPVTYYRSQS